MGRKLATIRKVENIRPIDGADKIEQCNIDGWNVVIQKGLYQEGDLAIYIEIDSLLNRFNPAFESMKDRGYKVKTIKLRGVLSQGMLFPLSIIANDINIDCLCVGEDLTDFLKIVKFEEEEDANEHLLITVENKEQSLFKRLLGKILKEEKEVYGKGGFPSFVKKTEAERLQNDKSVLNIVPRWIITEKLDGTSYTYVYSNKKTLFGKEKEYICSRNLRISPNSKDSLYVKITEQNKLKEYAKHVINTIQNEYSSKIYSIAVQGEILGKKIQGNKYNINTNRNELFLYGITLYDKNNNIIDVLSPFAIKYKIGSIIEVVPIIDVLSLNTMEEALKKSNIQSNLNKDTIAEGIVIYGKKPSSDIYSKYKVINPEFLLKHKI